MKKFFALVLALVMVLGLVACGEKAPAAEELKGVTEDTILVGNTAGTTGALATIGGPFNIGIEAAFAAYNAEGGFNGKSVKLQHYDDGGVATQSVTLTEQLIHEDEVFAIVGNFASNCVAANLPIIKEFPAMMLNMLQYYLPSTLEDHLYEVNDTVSLNARSPKLYVEGPGVETELEVFPNSLYVTEPGVYTFSQDTISGENVVENIFVKIPAKESNIKLVEDSLENPAFEDVNEIEDKDLIFYFALALFVLLFCEWILQLKEYF